MSACAQGVKNTKQQLDCWQSCITMYLVVGVVDRAHGLAERRLVLGLEHGVDNLDDHAALGVVGADAA